MATQLIEPTTRREWLRAAALAAGSTAAACLRADDPPAEKPSVSDQQLAQLEQEMDERIRLFTVQSQPGDGEPQTLSPVKLAKWTNEVRGQLGFGLCYGYPDDGRIAAICDVYPWSGKLNFEFGSLARERIRATLDGVDIWSPDTAQGSFQPLPDSPVPAKSKPLRLQQLKELARRFEVMFLGWRGSGQLNEPLRLQPTPLYRNERPAETVVDGALFNFVQGVDPEAVLALEVVRAGDAERFEYALRRRTSAGLEAAYAGKTVWTLDASTTNRDARSLFFCIGLTGIESL